MKIKVQNPSVRHNVALFKQLLEKVDTVSPKPSSLEATGVKTFHAFVHRMTGDLAFPELAQEKKLLHDKTWKPMTLSLIVEEKETTFEVEEEGKIPSAFRYDDLFPAARRILAETIHVLNTVAKQVGEPKSLDLLCKKIAQLSIEELSFSIPGKDIVHEAWHQLDRIETEKLLLTQPVGTFLFRKGEYTATLSEELQQKHPEEIRCFTLSYLEPEDKIVDLTIVKKGDRWFIYNDDPSLPEPSYPSIQGLLESLKAVLKLPLLH